MQHTPFYQSHLDSNGKIVDFGAFINLLPGKDGLLHISQICNDRAQKVEDVLKEGQDIEVFVAGVDKQGRVKLEWKDKPQAPEAKAAAPAAATEEHHEVANAGDNSEEE